MKTDETNNSNFKNENPNSLNTEKYTKRVEKIAKEDGYAKGVRVTALISLIVLITVGIVFYSMYNSEKKKQATFIADQKYSYTQLLTARDSAINEWVMTFDQIDKDLQTIKEKEKTITLNSSDREFTKDKKQRVLEDIKYINSLLDANKKKIAVLNEQLRRSGGSIKSLQDKMATLEASMKQSEAEISDLKVALADKNLKIDQLNTRVSDMQVDISQKTATIDQQTVEMHKGYVAYGTYKDLKAKGLINKEGGFLGLGKKEALIENFPDSSFARIDITQLKTIPVNSKKAKLITEHPTGSYEMVQGDDQKIAYIEIKDPDQFWKISKYAVVELGK